MTDKGSQLSLKMTANSWSFWGRGKIVPGYKELFPNIVKVLKDIHVDKTSSPNYYTFKLFRDMMCKEYYSLFVALIGQHKDLMDKIATMAGREEPFRDHLYLSTVMPKLSICLAKIKQIEVEQCDFEECDLMPLWNSAKPNSKIVQPFRSWVMMLVQLDAADALCSFVTQV